MAFTKTQNLLEDQANPPNEIPIAMDTKISALVVYNDETSHIQNCLERILFCDEIILILLGEKTALPEGLFLDKVKIFHHPWVPFGEQVRQFGIEKASHDWILFDDPDLYYPPNIDKVISSIISTYTNRSLAAILFPYRNFYGNQPLQRGKKARVNSFMGLIHRDRVSVDGLLHHRGLRVHEDGLVLGIVQGQQNLMLEHRWIDNISEAYLKAKRYLPYEGESRFQVLGSFRPKRAVRELLNNIWEDLREFPFLDRRSLEVMFFNWWYLIWANLEWRKFSRSQKKR